MTSSFQSRLGTAPEEAVKAPVKAVATAELNLSGLELVTTLEGLDYQTVAGDRILAASQTDKTTNGIYIVKAGAWERATDWNDNDDVVNGIMVLAITGPFLVQALTDDPFIIDTSEVTFLYTPRLNTIGNTQDALDAAAAAEAAQIAAEAAQTAAETAASNAANSASAAAADASVVVNGIRDVGKYTATGGETSIALSAFTPPITQDVVAGFFDVIMNGHNLCPGADFDDADGSSITGLVALSANDEIFVHSYGTFQLESSGHLLAANNLSDVQDAPTSRVNLGLGAAATRADGFFLQQANDLSDLADAPTARTNMGLGDVATQNAGDGLLLDGTDLEADINGLTTETPISTDTMMFYDASAAGLRKATITDIVAVGGGTTFQLSSVTASSQAEVTFTSLITSAYDEYLLRIIGAIPATNNVLMELLISTDNGATYKTTSYHNRRESVSTPHPEIGASHFSTIPVTTGSQTGINISHHQNNTTGASCNLNVRFWPNVANAYKLFMSRGVNFTTQAYPTGGTGCWTGGTAAVNAIKIKYASGNIQSGKFILYGIK